LKVILTRFQLGSSSGPLRPGEGYQDSEHELDGEGAIGLLESLGTGRSRLLIKGQYCNLEFEVAPERPLTVDIYDSREGFWAISEISPVSARRIILMAENGEQFGNLIPETKQEWAAYGLGSAGNR
jgi:hypothetical protein